MQVFRALVAAMLLSFAPALMAQQPEAAPAQPAAEAEAPTESAFQSGDWFSWPKMSGNWGGLRDQLAGQGITFDLDVTQVFENNALWVSPTSTGVGGGLYRDEGAPAASTCVPSGVGSTLTTISGVNALSGASGNIDDDCSVTNPVVGGDFHLMAGSACIDAGTATMAPATDFEGDARPMGAAPDIGPDEAG